MCNVAHRHHFCCGFVQIPNPDVNMQYTCTVLYQIKIGIICLCEIIVLSLFALIGVRHFHWALSTVCYLMH